MIRVRNSRASAVVAVLACVATYVPLAVICWRLP